MCQEQRLSPDSTRKLNLVTLSRSHTGFLDVELDLPVAKLPELIRPSDGFFALRYYESVGKHCIIREDLVDDVLDVRQRPGHKQWLANFVYFFLRGLHGPDKRSD